MHSVVLFAAAFLACSVEMVEALTIVLAVAVTRGWRSATWGIAAALGCLALIVSILGPSLSHLPINSLRLVVGTVLLIFGLQWLRKAVLRASGLKALHDEAAIYEENVAQLRAKGERSEHDWYGFTVAFKGVFLEGLEVAFIIVTFGGTQRNVGLAALAAGAALIVVLIAGILVHAPLTRVPENALKFVVGIMLTSFGIFWSAEGAGVAWPGSDASILMVIAFVVGIAVGLVAVGRRTHVAEVASTMKWLKQFGLFWYDFIVGDDWRIAVGVVGAVAIVYLAAHRGFNGWWILPFAVAILLSFSVVRVVRDRLP